MPSLEHDSNVVYILGTAYSGTTLFSLALGTHPELLNLGEVSSLEHDYQDARKCSCGESLATCSFWSRVKTGLEARQAGLPADLRWRLETSTHAEWLDQRNASKSFLFNLKLLSGVPVTSLATQKYLGRYREKNRLFFESVQTEFPDYRYIIDCSKQPERLEALSFASGIKLRVIFLKRNERAIFASSLKRLRRRNHPLFGKGISFVQALGYAVWLKAQIRRSQRIFDSIEPFNRTTVHFDDFLASPTSVLSQVENWLGLSSSSRANRDVLIVPSHQHIYVGNRWVFNEPDKPTQLYPRDDLAALNKSQMYVMKLIFRN